jgi:dolichyl-phosphate-mannose--protein O-mannosyl transferase/Gpi18-like mannosyltransferase
VSTSNADLRSGIRSRLESRSSLLWLWVLLGAGFLIRLIFLGDNGFANDVSSFEAWALALSAHPFSQFYSSTSFADYPPGYFYVLWAVGKVFAIAGHGNVDVLRYLVKMPAVLMDLVNAAVLYALVLRFAGERWALGVAALYVLNPAVIFISASWGQVDSISAGFALIAAWLLLRSDDPGSPAYEIPLAWVVLGYSLLVKPQAAILIPLFLVFAFTNREKLKARTIGTALGIAGALLLAFMLTIPFHPTADPVNAFAWLYHQYSYAKDVYAANSVNAFNLWSIFGSFWIPDSTPLIFGIPKYVGGMVLAGAAVAIVVGWYAVQRTPRAFLESAALLTLAFFMLATRMHERYIYDGLLFTMAAVPLARRYLTASIVFSITLFVNLLYSFIYLQAVLQHWPGVNTMDMWPAVTHPLSFINVAVFFYLVFVYLGPADSQVTAGVEAPSGKSAPRTAAQISPVFKARAWYDPREGLGSMAWPLDYLLAGFFGAVSFILSFVNYWLPNEKVFDEIYFARAGEEYLTHRYIYENTHPPLTKLIIAFSMLLFGGMHGGDNPHGWRFLDVLFGAIVIVVLYAFAKRLTRSSVFASFAAIMLTADGMHFVQSRIATPEGIVIVFSLGTLYAFYRYWIASQSVVRAYEPETRRRALIAAAGAVVLGGVCAAIANPPLGGDRASLVVGFVYAALGWYLALRLWVVPRVLKTRGRFASYPEGSTLVESGQARKLSTPDGRIVQKELALREDAATITYRRDGSVRYATPVGTAVYTPGQVADDSGDVEEGRHATGWFLTFTLLLGALVSSKWYGVMAYGVSFIVIAAVWAQRYWRSGKLKQWGNPYGFRLDVALAAIAFLSATLYICVWIPDFFRHIEIKSFSDLVYRQYSMFEYHDTLKATHPYASRWWTWPLDLRPIAYYWKDLRTGLSVQNPNACCVAEIISLPNPLILWFGLIAVPAVAFLAWRERNKGYALLIVAYLLQWVPWALSPRIAWIYHFYVNVPLVVLCNVIVLQRIWNRPAAEREIQIWQRVGVCAYVGAVVLAFVWFYPILSGTPIPWDQWWARMWLKGHWV